MSDPTVTHDHATFTSAEGAYVVDILATHAALPLLLEGLFLEDVGFSLPRLLTHTQRKMRFTLLLEIQIQDQT